MLSFEPRSEADTHDFESLYELALLLESFDISLMLLFRIANLRQGHYFAAATHAITTT
jgi:hypothetical protein